jgi:nucleoside-diphosphate-sugar epimerase
MRVVVVGATGNVGTALLAALVRAGGFDLVGVARQPPHAGGAFAHLEWHAADVGSDDLTPAFRGADAVVHLAWQIQPSHDQAQLRRTNVAGSERVFRSAADAGVRSLVYASSVGAYSPGPKERRVDESWPTGGVPSSFYSRHKAEVERLLDRLEADAPALRVVRLRPSLVFSRHAASGIRRLFLGPLFPRALADPRRIPLVPDMPRLVFQAVHSEDVAEAYRLALVSDVRGAFNVAAEPPLDPAALAELLGARRVPLPVGLARRLVDVSWRLRLQPTPDGWVDLGLGAPTMDTTRARTELGWTPRYSAGAALLDLLAGLRDGAGLATPALDPAGGGRQRREPASSR